jgi:hypothetical protein
MDTGTWGTHAHTQVSDEATHRFSLTPVATEAEGAGRRRCEYWALACSLLPELTNTVHLLEEAIKEERLTRRQNLTLLAEVRVLLLAAHWERGGWFDPQ